MKTWSMPVCDGKSCVIPCSCCGELSFNKALDCEGFGYVRCNTCGLVQMNPQPVKDDIITRYSRTYGNDYLSYELENEKVFLKLQKLALKDAGFYRLEKDIFLCAEGIKPPAILDVGCATGALLAEMKNRLWRVTGVEISPCAVYAQNERKLDVRNIPLEDIKFPDANFDVVLASHLIEHLNNPLSFLEETHRILKENGCVFITTPNIQGLQAGLFGGKWRSAIFDHLFLFSKRTLAGMLKKTGFKVEEIRTWGGIASGYAPLWIKKPLDLLAKPFGFGDVMIVRARKVRPV